MSNVGPAPAYDLAVLWASRQGEPPLAEAAVLAPFASLSWRFGELQVGPSDAPPPDALTVAYLVVRWRMAGARSRRVVSIPISGSRRHRRCPFDDGGLVLIADRGSRITSNVSTGVVLLNMLTASAQVGHAR